MEEKTVRVKAGAGYDVHIGSGLLDSCGYMISEISGKCRAAVVTDSTVAGLYLPRVMASLEVAGLDPVSFVFPQGEESKNLRTLAEILESFADNQLTRSDIVIALGGGVTGDLAGFAAGVYMRGIKYVQLPTTLLAAVDSSVGGKTAVDLSAGKNMAGVFLQPSCVICDTDALSTLSPEIFADGASESIKYGVLSDTDIFCIFENGDVSTSLNDIISRCVSIKGALVEQDELDNGVRRFLNLGHTIGHAIENLSGYTFPHGHAVAVGMAMITRAGEKMGITEKGTLNRLINTLKRNGLPTETDYTVDALYTAALSDKKRSGSTITIVMPEKIGKCRLMTIPVPQLEEIIALGREM